MDDVESIVLTSCRLLNAIEVSLVAETEPDLICFFALDVATSHAEAQHRSVQNMLYVCNLSSVCSSMGPNIERGSNAGKEQ